MSGLEEVGIPGPNHLREALTNCTDPLTAIEDFQLQNGILLPSLRPSLPFLDLHGIRRLEFHQAIMEDLRDRLLQRVSELAAKPDKNNLKTLNDLLTKSFPVVNVKSLRPVVLCIMQHLPKIKQEYLSVIVENKELYKESSVEVKQQIWQDNQALFGDEVSPLLSKYIDDRENLLFNHQTDQPAFFQSSSKTRRQDKVVQQLTKMVGKNIKLYDMVLQFLRTLFLRTRNVHYCTLRAELLMALHDADAHEIVNLDPCHKFAWCLDACIREKNIDSKRLKELQGFLDGLKRGAEQVLGDLSMILCDPHAIHTLSMSVTKALQLATSSESLPRYQEDLIIVLRMLRLGLLSWQMVDSQQFKEMKLEATFITKFLPGIVSLMVDDQVQLLSGRLDETATQLDPVPQCVITANRDNTMANIITIYYGLNIAKLHDVKGIARILPLLASCDIDTVYSDTILHMLVSHLATMPDCFANTEFCELVFQQFFVPMVSRENVVRHFLRLLWWVHPKVPSNIIEPLLKGLEPNKQHSEAVHETYKALNAKISNYQPSPVATPEKIDSPLMAVPAPTPAHP
ncbi:hypothetical protein CAPTEDRAFT_172048 [Capitella teleta]|uniref:Negative elongation factor B n=1 Tax=Capitella teleta TaxID=283909 RepID=R7TDD1_CAPTE|nr:hypothetical protein CAPTEDRAFT_172048 [Capitella teleta]|eukprot:ELT91507.1 hypothetical protein CAPTEDRAFT_172048 [Capitella teleta]